MRLDRNTNPDGRGKYALVKLRYVDSELREQLLEIDAVDFGATENTEFFVIRLKDIFAAPALAAYALAAWEHDEDYARDVLALAKRAALCPHKQLPD
jgi:hypothetical protein